MTQGNEAERLVAPSPGSAGETTHAGSAGVTAVDSRLVRSRPLSFYLSLLVAAIVVPALLFSIVLLQRNNDAQRDALETLAEATAGSITEAVDREVRGMLTTLRVLATKTSLREEDLAAFHARAREALSDSGAYVLVLDGTLHQLLNTRVDYGTPLGQTSDPDTARYAQANKVVTVSDGFLGRTAKRWVFNVVLPPSVSNIANRYLVLTQDAANLVDALSQQNLRGGWNVSLLDSNGNVLASSYMSSDVGKPFFLGQNADGVARGKMTPDGEERDFLTISNKSDMTNWRVVLWAPTSIVDDPLRRSLLSLLLGAVLVTALAVGAAWLLGRQISRTARGLARDARRLGQGEEVSAVAYPIAEFATVSTAIARAAHDRREAENEIRFLMREVAHRSKNQLTVVGSIAKQTARSSKSLAAFQEAFQRRLQGLARSTDLLIAGGVAGVELGELLRAQIEPFKPDDPSRLNVTGPTFRLGHHAAQTIGMAAHELATNAAKYGALSVASGRLEVTWRLAGDDLELEWNETVPPLRKRPETAGFGTQVIERMLGGTLDASIDRRLERTGLRCRFVMPQAKLRPLPLDGD